MPRQSQSRVYDTDPHITFFVELDPRENDDPWVYCTRAVIDGKDQANPEELHQAALDKNRAKNRAETEKEG